MTQRDKRKVKRRRYTDDDRAAAVKLASEIGARDAAEQIGTTRRTIERWCVAAGVSLDRRAEDIERMRNARAALAARVAEQQLERVAALESTLTAATIALTDRLAVDHAAADAVASIPDDQLEAAVKYVDTLAGPKAELVDPIARRRVDVAALLNSASAPLRDIEGVITRTLHDLQLLAGDATERAGLVIEFGGISRPNADTVEEVVNLAAD